MNDLDMKYLSAIADQLPNRHYNPVFVVGDKTKIIEGLLNFLGKCPPCLDEQGAEVAMHDNDPCECYIVEDFEGIENDDIRQNILISNIDYYTAQGTQIIIMSNRRLDEMKIDGRLNARLRSGIVVE